MSTTPSSWIAGGSRLLDQDVHGRRRLAHGGEVLADDRDLLDEVPDRVVGLGQRRFGVLRELGGGGLETRGVFGGRERGDRRDHGARRHELVADREGVVGDVLRARTRRPR